MRLLKYCAANEKFYDLMVGQNTTIREVLNRIKEIQKSYDMIYNVVYCTVIILKEVDDYTKVWQLVSNGVWTIKNNIYSRSRKIKN